MSTEWAIPILSVFNKDVTTEARYGYLYTAFWKQDHLSTYLIIKGLESPVVDEFPIIILD